MLHLKAESIGPVWIEYLQAIVDNGSWVHDDREEILETPPVVFTINDFEDKEKVLARYANQHVIDVYTEKMFSMDMIEELNSTYGDRFFANLGVDQIDLAIKKLKDNPWAKSCFVPLVVPDDPGPRVPCLSALQIAVRDNKVQFFSTFRSQNAYNSYGNFLGIRALQELVAEKLGLEAGRVYFFVNFPHIYKSDVAKAKAVLSECIENSEN